MRLSDPERYVEYVCHAVRVATDLGASVVETPYTGSRDTFRRVVDAAAPLPVLIAGGALVHPLAALQIAADAVGAGAAGVSFGRNVFGREPSGAMVRALRSVVHEGVDADAAYSQYRPT